MKNLLWVTLLLAAFFALAVVIGNIMASLTQNSTKNLCHQYEAQGYLPANSCYCSSQLFDNWEESYNWIDACKILEAKQKK